FIVQTGAMTMDVRDEAGNVSSYSLDPGQLLVVHRGTEHRARCSGSVTLIDALAWTRKLYKPNASTAVILNALVQFLSGVLTLRAAELASPLGCATPRNIGAQTRGGRRWEFNKQQTFRRAETERSAGDDARVWAFWCRFW